MSGSHVDNTPVHRTYSLQSPLSSSHGLPARPAVPAQGPAFADVARGLHLQTVDKPGIEEPTSGPLPLSNLLRLQPTRSRKGNKNWRPLQPADLSSAADMGDIDNGASSTPAGGITKGVLSNHVVDSSHDSDGGDSDVEMLREASRLIVPFDTPVIEKARTGDPHMASSPSKHACVAKMIVNVSNNTSPTVAHADILECYERLFGRLPDLIRLQEQTGDCDGHVVFISHPNRDISAHQWSADSFQWINIGQWSHTRARIEGSLAADLLTNTDLPRDTIESFKFAAEERQSLVKTFGRPYDRSGSSGISLAIDSEEQSGGVAGASRSLRSSFSTEHVDASVPDEKSASLLLEHESRRVTQERLEDPFITPQRTSLLSRSPMTQLERNSLRRPSCASFSYTLPSNASSAPQTRSHAIVDRSRESQEKQTLSSASSVVMQLREVGFGEEAANTLARLPVLHQVQQSTYTDSPERNSQRVLTEKVRQLSEQAHARNNALSQRAPSPGPTHAAVLTEDIRALFPPGPTVANPYRSTSILKASAPAYTHKQISFQGTALPPRGATARISPAILHFSDPDDHHRQAAYEIANGLAKQAPTPQSWSGRFFAETMPTNSNLIAPLTVHESEEQKLANWFHDGHRPARQQDYAKSLMKAAIAVSKPGSLTPGSGSLTREQALQKYENTPVFVRVYENLYEYMEESHVSHSTSYFTRAWKPANNSICDQRPGGNSSFFSSKSNGTALTKTATPTGLFRPARLVEPRVPDLRFSTLRTSRLGSQALGQRPVTKPARDCGITFGGFGQQQVRLG